MSGGGGKAPKVPSEGNKMTEETHHVNLVWQPPSGHEQKPSSLEFAAPQNGKKARKRHVEFLINRIVTLAIEASTTVGMREGYL